MDNLQKPKVGSRASECLQACLDALRDLLNEHPLSSISIEAIAERSGVGKPTIYRHYRDKSALFIDLYERESAGRFLIQDMGSLEKELTELVIQTWRFWRETASGQGFRQLIARSQSSIPSLNRFRDEFLPRRRVFLEVILRRAITRGEIPDDDYTAFIDLFFGFNFYHSLTNNLGDESVIPKEISILLRGIIRK